jgi:superfamily II DNA or RNA helicase
MQLRAGQEDCLRAIANNECGIVDATMGFGKTALFEAIAHMFPRAKIDILVKPKDVAETIVRRLTKTIPNVGHIGGGNKRPGGRVTVCTAGSIHHVDATNTDILLADEVHQLVTPSVGGEIAKTWRWSRNYGLTGTYEKRQDGADAQLEVMFGGLIYRITYQEAQAAGLVVPIRVRWLQVRMDHNPADGKSDTAKKRWGIWRNQQRNKAIADDIRTRFPDNSKQILILVETIEHAIML